MTTLFARLARREPTRPDDPPRGIDWRAVTETGLRALAEASAMGLLMPPPPPPHQWTDREPRR